MKQPAGKKGVDRGGLIEARMEPPIQTLEMTRYSRRRNPGNARGDARSPGFRPPQTSPIIMDRFGLPPSRLLARFYVRHQTPQYRLNSQQVARMEPPIQNLEMTRYSRRRNPGSAWGDARSPGFRPPQLLPMIMDRVGRPPSRLLAYGLRPTALQPFSSPQCMPLR
jgi:hypothetical protein